MAKTYLDVNENWLAANAGEEVFGNGAEGAETVAVIATGVKLDQNVENVTLGANIAAYTFKQAGNGVEIYMNEVLVADVRVQDDANGTAITFADVIVNAKFGTDSVVTLGGKVLSETDDVVVNIADLTEYTLIAGPGDGTTFKINGNTYEVGAAGEDVDGVADVMHLTGDMNVRIDVTSSANQITALDLDGSGAFDQEMNNDERVTGVAAGFEIIDAYARNGYSDDLATNFYGDIAFDGTGFGGDGVSTDGNIFLGGLGADVARAGIGNDFLTGGGVLGAGMDALYGGRNADFFFASLSDLTTTDGDSLMIDGGQTTDDNAVSGDTAMDADWLLLEVADDEDGTVIDLRVDGTSIANATGQTVISGNSASMISMNEIEHVDASGNLYGFLNALDDVALGENGQFINGENVAIGASSQIQVLGSSANNIFIGGYDNDTLEGRDGNDLLMGGNLNYALNNPNAAGIANDGKDYLYGGLGADNIVFEADGGVINGHLSPNEVSSAADNANDTLWLTNLSAGTAEAIPLRFDLLASTLANSAGYGGADVDGTQDQSIYTGTSLKRVTVTNMENVIATGLGAVDYVAAGTNDPELNFANQQNHFAYTGDLDLRGTDGVNTLYASVGTDVLEGREGGTLTFDNAGVVTADNRDKLSGGDQADRFIFSLADQDGVDVIHRQTDLDVDGDGAADNLTDGTFGQDFGVLSSNLDGKSFLIADFPAIVDLTDPNVGVTQFQVTIDGVVFGADLAAADLSALETTADIAEVLNAAYNAIDADVTVAALDADTIIVEVNRTDAVIGTNLAGGTIIAGTAVSAPFQVNPRLNFIDPTLSGDELVYASYEDRADGELVDDNSTTGSTISLGTDGYAEDLVIDFAADGTRIAEDQSYVLTFTNLTTEDIVTVTVNGVNYRLQVGVDLDGNEIAGEELLTQGGTAATQTAIQTAFLTRLQDYINSFMDDDTAAGEVAAVATATTLTLTQVDYNGEETVFMSTPTVALVNGSTGEPASVTVQNNSQHEVQLLDFDGREGNLNADNVLFIGNTEMSRAILATGAGAAGTANTLSGSDAVIVDGGADTLSGIYVGAPNPLPIANNTATNSFLAMDFTVHGDDLLVSGVANDTVLAGTGDDRVIGSLGTDIIDGGKSYYAVKVLGEDTARVYMLNEWEATNPSQVTALNTLTISSINRIGDAESGIAAVNSAGLAEVYDDTLQFEQADFNAGTRFTISLTNFTGTSAATVQFRNGGAGIIAVDNGGDGTVDGTTAFTNFENIRTVSGTGNAVAGPGGGQGNDTLNVSTLSNTVGGVSYDLTNRATAGDVRYSANNHASATIPVEGDFEALVIKVDGVESFIAGTGDDLLMLDETEAAKSNVFTGNTGDDRIVYLNDFTGATALDAEPRVTIKLDTTAAINSASTGSDTVTMTGGRLGTVQAIDQLGQIERVALEGNTARSSAENDTLDVTAFTTGATVDYILGQVRVGAVVHVTVEGMVQLENVIADGNDTVIVADAATMNDNSRSDEGVDATPADDILFMTYLDFDELNTGATTRESFASQVAAGTAQQVINQGQFSFSLSEVGTEADVDRVDYSAETGRIIAPVGQETDLTPQYLIVDGDSDANLANAESRIDVLVDVEEIVASLGQSVLDFTTVNADRQITFTYVDPSSNPADDALLEQTIRIADGNGNTIDGLNAFVEKYIYNEAVDTTDDATWNRVEGGDNDEVVIYEGSEDLDEQAGIDHRYADDVLTLRGGDNEVRYSPLETSIEVVITVVEEDTTTTTVSEGLITAVVDFQDGDMNPLVGAGTHTITSYTSDNSTAAGSLKIEASQDAEDVVEFNSGSEQFFTLGASPGVIRATIGSLNTMTLTGFEFLRDAATDDVYFFQNMITGMDYLDNGAADTDTIKVNNDAIGFDGATFGTLAAPDNDLISMDQLELGINIDFNILDVTEVTTGSIDLLGTAADVETVIIDNLSLFDLIEAFDTIKLAAGTPVTGTINVNLDTEVLSNASNTIDIDNTDLDTLDLSALTSAVTVTVTDTTAIGLEVIGTAGNDSITGASGNDVFQGGDGDDTLDGSVIPELLETLTFGFNNGGQLGAAFSTLTDLTDYIEITDGTGAIRLYDDGSVAGDVDGFAGGVASVAILAAGSTGLVSGSDNDAVGNAIANIIDSAWATYLPDFTIGSVGYESVGNVLTFTYATTEDPIQGADLSMTVVDGGAAGTLEANTILVDGNVVQAAQGDGWTAEQNSIDTFVFEATAAANGADTIQNFDAGDILDLTAFVTDDAPVAEVAEAALALGVIVDNGVYLVSDADGSLNTAAEVLALITSIAANGEAVVAVRDTQVNGDTTLWYVDNDATAALVATEITLVGTLVDFNTVLVDGNILN